MVFINRKEERVSFKKNYEENAQDNVSQVYVIEADHGIGKSEFIKEVSKYFSNYPLEIFQCDENEELSVFKRMVLELDKASAEYGYDDFKTYFRKKVNNTKAIRLLLKITAIFGQTWAMSKGFDIKCASLIEDSIQSEKFILNAQIENLFEYSKYVFTTVDMHVIFHHTKIIDSGSLNLLSKLIAISQRSVFIFESNNTETSSRIEHFLQNSHSVFYKKYILEKLSDIHIQKYIQQLLTDLKIEADYIDSTILKESIEKGDLAEISSILKDFNDRLKTNHSIKIRSTKEILQSLSEKQCAILILVSYSNGKLNINEIRDIINELNPASFNMSDIDLLFGKNLIEKNNNYVSLLPFVYDILNVMETISFLKYAVSSALIKYINTKLTQVYNNRYVDILVDFYLNNNQFSQLKSLLPQISKRLKRFNTQAERIDYFKKFVDNHQKMHISDLDLSIQFAKIAYDLNLYSEALEFINLVRDEDHNIIFMKALILNRCEEFIQSEKYIRSKINRQSPIYFNLSLVHMMNLIQLNKRNEAKNIFDELKSYTQEPLFLYLIRLSNIFYKDYEKRLEIVESITNKFYETQDDEFSGLHAIYLAYLYALTQQPDQAEKALSKARNFFGNNLIYNHMILHNEATIKFHNHEIDEDICILLNNAKITAYDKYDLFAVNNNLLVFYILSNNIACFESQNVAFELEKMLNKTKYKRFVDKIHYNLYHYFVKMYNYEKSEYYKTKLLQENIKFDNDYKYKLMYETSWKLPINLEH